MDDGHGQQRGTVAHSGEKFPVDHHRLGLEYRAEVRDEGATDAAGVFHLSTLEPKDGALPGKYKVIVQPPASLNTGDGQVSVDLPVTVSGPVKRSHVRGTLNGGGGSLTVRTGDGAGAIFGDGGTIIGGAEADVEAGENAV